MAYSDGTFTSVKQNGITRVQYPFLNSITKDSTTKQYEADYVILPGFYSPAAALSTWPGDGGTISSDSSAYLVFESEPQRISGAYGITRRYSKIPSTQYVYSTDYISKPTPAGSSSSAYEAWLISSGGAGRSRLESAARWLNPSNGSTYPWHSSGRFFNAGANRAGALTVATGGTFTITYKTSTTAALNWNDSNATIAAAINALAAITTDGVTVTVSNALGTAGVGNLTITVSAGTALAAFSMSSSLTPAAASTVFIYYTALNVQAFWIAPRYTITAHGYNTSNPIHASYELSDAIYIHEFPSGQWSSVDANTIAINRGALKATGSYLTLFIAPYLRDYMPGAAFVRYRFKSDFYLPGVSVGITTVDDIPIPTPADADNAFLAAIVGNSSSWTTYRAEALRSWDGPILEQRQQQVIFANIP